MFAFTKRHEIRKDESCLDLGDSKKKGKVLLWKCHLQGGNQYWVYDEKVTKNIVSKANGLCVTLKANKLALEQCREQDENQIWEMKNAEELNSLLKLYSQ